MVFALAGDSTMTKSGPVAFVLRRLVGSLVNALTTGSSLLAAAFLRVVVFLAVDFDAGTMLRPSFGSEITVVTGDFADTIPLATVGDVKHPYYTGSREVKPAEGIFSP